MPRIEFHDHDASFTLAGPGKTRKWLERVIALEGHRLEHLNYIFCSDEHLLQINQQYLNHRTLTDIITFDNSDEDGVIEGDIFISIPRVEENARKFQIPFRDELHRVLVHGTLHLLGYKDKTPDQKGEMRKKEDAYLSLRNAG